MLEPRLFLSTTAPSTDPVGEIVPREWIVRLDQPVPELSQLPVSGFSLLEGDAGPDVQIVRQLSSNGVYLLQAPESQSYSDLISQVERLDGFRYLEPIYRLSVLATTPNDTSFNSLWGLNNTGQTGGTADDPRE